ncbi:MAG: phosphomannomutase/phosphoglucomutase [Candidatus Spechtbacteria bacterium]|nr:phosphomannomutase/phosphoglucomutase [Candidatus Spechtbacteria bacterium]
MNIDPYIFREYDIRGVAGVEFTSEAIAEYEKWYGKFPGVTINLETAKAIGMAYGAIIKRGGGKKVIIGYEIRPYAEELKGAFVGGILSVGIDVVDAGKTMTPMIYFLVSYLGLDGGVNITGSHNVYFFNGFKPTKKGTAPIYGEELQRMRQMVLDDDYDVAESRGNIEMLNNAYEQYRDYALERIKLKKKLNIVIDCGNGTPGLYVMDYFTKLGCNVMEGLYLEPNAYFPNHIPDPEAPQNMQMLSKRVKELGADIGIGFDADGDRVGFVDENGTFVNADDFILFLAKDALSRNPGKKILFDVKCSQVLVEMIPQLGGIPLMHRTGHANIKDTLRHDPDIILGGEKSGHIYICEDYYKIDDAFYAAALMLRLLSEHDGPFSSMFSIIPHRVRTPEIKLPCEDSVKHDVVSRVSAELSQKYNVITIDGARVMFDAQSWGLIRASNTSPYLTARFEALTDERVLEMKNIFADILETFPEIQDKLDREHVASLTGKLGYV